MSTWAEVFLGIIAFGALVTGVFQLGLMVAGIRMVKQVSQLIDRADHAIEPTVARVNALAAQASSVVSHASAQVQRAEVVFDEVQNHAARVSSTLRTVAALPKRETSALAAGARAALNSFNTLLFKTGPNGRRATHTDRIEAGL